MTSVHPREGGGSAPQAGEGAPPGAPASVEDRPSEQRSAPEGQGSSPGAGPPGASGLVGPGLFQIRAVRDLALLGVVLGVLSFALELVQALAPVLLGFLGAYLLAPFVRWLEARGIKRGLVVLVTSVTSTALTGAALGLLVPRLLRELDRLRERAPTYLELLSARTGLDASKIISVLDIESALGALDRVQPLLGIVGSVVGTTAYGILFVVLFLISFTFFNLELEQLPYISRYVPRSQRERFEPSLEVVARVFRGFLRGQLTVMLFTGTVYTLGFWLLGVPYGFVAALVGGVLSIIPYGQLAGPLLAIAFNLLEGQVAGALDPVRSIALPALVYAVMQSLESFVVTPLVQGAATRLHPVAILACLAAGGSVGGLLGVFLAIPVTASAWIIAKERLFPAWRAWADRS